MRFAWWMNGMGHSMRCSRSAGRHRAHEVDPLLHAVGADAAELAQPQPDVAFEVRQRRDIASRRARRRRARRWCGRLRRRCASGTGARRGARADIRAAPRGRRASLPRRRARARTAARMICSSERTTRPRSDSSSARPGRAKRTPSTLPAAADLRALSSMPFSDRSTEVPMYDSGDSLPELSKTCTRTAKRSSSRSGTPSSRPTRRPSVPGGAGSSTTSAKPCACAGGAIVGGRAGGGDHDQRNVREALVGADGGDGRGGVTVGQDAIDEAEIGAGAQLLQQIVGVARGDEPQIAAAQQVAIEVVRQIRIVRSDDRLHGVATDITAARRRSGSSASRRRRSATTRSAGRRSRGAA